MPYDGSETHHELDAEVRKLMREAADLVERGWCQHAYHERAGGEVRHCVLGALCAARGFDWDTWEPDGADDPDLLHQDPAVLEARQRLLEFTGVSPHSWNDMPGRTARQVALVLRELADVQR